MQNILAEILGGGDTGNGSTTTSTNLQTSTGNSLSLSHWYSHRKHGVHCSIRIEILRDIRLHRKRGVFRCVVVTLRPTTSISDPPSQTEEQTKHTVCVSLKEREQTKRTVPRYLKNQNRRNRRNVPLPRDRVVCPTHPLPVDEEQTKRTVCLLLKEREHAKQTKRPRCHRRRICPAHPSPRVLFEMLTSNLRWGIRLINL